MIIFKARGYYVASGFNGQGLSLGGGLGAILAEWITTSLPGEVAKIDVARFLDLHSNPQYLQERAPEIGSKFSGRAEASKRNIV